VRPRPLRYMTKKLVVMLLMERPLKTNGVQLFISLMRP
jgi:hypothetical protein